MAARWIVWMFVLCRRIFCQSNLLADTYAEQDLSTLDSLLKNYDRRITPRNHLNGPTNVSCSLYLRSFGAINPETMDYEVDLNLRQKWQDHRLHSSNITRPLDLNDPELVKKVWKPGVYFTNAKSGEFQYVTVPNVLFRIYPDGRVLYMIRLKLKFSCMMDMSKYPLDTQVCTIEVAVFSKTTQEVELQWADRDGVELYKGLKMAQFVLTEVTLTQCKESFKIGEYSCLRAELGLKRSIGHHLVQSYMPTTLIVVISWVSFWLEVDSIPGRITLGVTTLLTISTESRDQQANLAPVSYVKALDVWMGACTMFVFAAVLEFTIVNCLARRKSSLIAEPNAKIKSFIIDISSSDRDVITRPLYYPSWIQAKRVDQASRVLFPLAFCIFNVVYWAYYLW